MLWTVHVDDGRDGDVHLHARCRQRHLWRCGVMSFAAPRSSLWPGHVIFLKDSRLIDHTTLYVLALLVCGGWNLVSKHFLWDSNTKYFETDFHPLHDTRGSALPVSMPSWWCVAQLAPLPVIGGVQLLPFLSVNINFETVCIRRTIQIVSKLVSINYKEHSRVLTNC